jgi:Tfp pilus assembly protein PilF
MIHVNKLIIILVLFSVFSCADDKVTIENVGSITFTYLKLERQYDESLSKGNYGEAFNYAEELLKIDPSDALVYLKLAIATQHLEKDFNRIRNFYSHGISEGSKEDKRIKDLANIILGSQKK